MRASVIVTWPCGCYDREEPGLVAWNYCDTNAPTPCDRPGRAGIVTETRSLIRARQHMAGAPTVVIGGGPMTAGPDPLENWSA